MSYKEQGFNNSCIRGLKDGLDMNEKLLALKMNVIQILKFIMYLYLYECNAQTQQILKW